MSGEPAHVDYNLAGDWDALNQVIAGDSRDPHAVLGAHPFTHNGEQGLVVRCFVPGTHEIVLLAQRTRFQMQKIHGSGVFACFLPGKAFPFSYQLEIADGSGNTAHRADPYAFAPTLGDLDVHLAAEGTHYRLYEKLGAHPRTIDGTQGTSFALWAPAAQRVSVVGSFNDWDGRPHQMRQMGVSGLWELFIPDIGVGALYKFELKLNDGSLRVKTDPLAFEMELRPNSASVVRGLSNYQWDDSAWMDARAERDPRQSPMCMYEVHLGSWLRDEQQENGWLTYRQIAPRLVDYCVDHGFTHIELMPIAEHAFDPSWGYQTTGYFAPTSRYGTPDDLRFMIDLCHKNNIAVVLDWVPAHFPKDDYALRWFDGTCLYEHADPREGEHRDWGTLIFNYGRNEVRAFLLSNAAYWLKEFHFDGLRVDAVASMIYRDYSRPDGEWVPNQYGGRENLEAISILQELNTVVYAECPGVVTIAEESTAWPGVSKPAYLGGLGFGFKWNMGWMHDTLRYFSKEPVHRQYHHNDLTFSLLYAWTENFVLPLSHDEVVHGKGSLIGKMPGDDWQKAANLRLLLAFLYTHPGKKLLFMGGEIGQWREWDYASSLQWDLLENPRHAGISQLVKNLGRIYRDNSALWAWDCEPKGFQWIDCSDSNQSVIAFVRRGPEGELVCVFNFTPVPRGDYRIGVTKPGVYLEYLNSDADAFGGSNVGNYGKVTTDPYASHGFPQSVNLTLPPLGALILKLDEEASRLEFAPDENAGSDKDAGSEKKESPKTQKRKTKKTP